MMTVQKFLEQINLALSVKTLYVSGCFGAPMTDANKARYSSNNDYNSRADRKAKIMSASADTFGFDCVCLIKGVLWGWNGETNKQYGGAKYASNGVPDISADRIIKVCPAERTDWQNIVPGALLYKPGHVGIYLGNGKAAECTPIWNDCVQVSYVQNVGASGNHNRTWTSWGLLPYVDYTQREELPFVDVKTDSYYYEAVKWAYQNGITNGLDATHFGPDKPVTRAQLVTMLWRMNQ